jgi:hypothetical protein
MSLTGQIVNGISLVSQDKTPIFAYTFAILAQGKSKGHISKLNLAKSVLGGKKCTLSLPTVVHFTALFACVSPYHYYIENRPNFYHFKNR